MRLTKENSLKLLKKWCLAFVNIALFSPILMFFIHLNDFTFSRPLLYFFIGVQLIFILLPKWYLWFPTQIFLSTYLVYLYFPSQETFSRAWLQLFFQAVTDPIVQLLAGEITLLPSILSFLLIISLLLITSYTLLKRYNPYPSFITGLGYLLILQVFTTTELFNLVVSTLFFGLVLIGITKLDEKGSWRNTLLTLVLLSAGAFLFIRVSLWGVKHLTQQQAWTISQTDGFYESIEEEGFFDWIDRYSPGGVSSRSGFSDDDSNLGGPLTQRHNTVFIAHTNDPHYWLIEAKEIYTGTGWETGQQELINMDLELFQLFDKEKSTIELQDIIIEPSESFSYIPYTHDTIGFDFHENTNDISFQMEIPTHQYILEDSKNLVDHYTLTLAPVDFDPELIEPSTYNEDLGEEFHTRYTQLPEALPERVVELAHSLTKDATTPYEQVRAIENYLKKDGGFRYSVSEAAYIPEGRDYVDHFLFDTKVGYCDNYSTAMVVLCRALGLPTRWAKGFNSGEEMNTGEDSYYEVTNANAHSWPEVYFAGYGWVPFEPTPPFDQPLTGDIALEEDFDDTITPEEEAVQESEAREDAEESSENSESELAMEAENDPTSPTTESWLSQHVGKISLLIFLVAIILFGVLKRWSILIWLVKKLLGTPLLNLQKQLDLVNFLFTLKKKALAEQTIRQYYQQWISILSEQEKPVRAFIQLMEETTYAPPLNETAISPRQQNTILNMVSVFEAYQQQSRGLTPSL